MRKKTFIVISLWAVAALCWAFVFALRYTNRTVFVHTVDLESMPGIRVLDANNATFQILRMKPNRVEIKWKESSINLKESKCRVKKLDYQSVHVMAGFNNKQYRMAIDSGYYGEVLVNDVFVIENDLKIYPLETGDLFVAGLCHVDKIEIGDMTITTPLCFYKLNHYEWRVLGLTIWKQRQIIFGVQLMRQFRYVLIDNIAAEVEFSKQESFEADPVETWRHYQMSIENDKKNIARLMIEIPIAGEKTKIMFDTGHNSTLVMAENKWKKLSTKLHVVEETNDRAQMPYGWNDIKRITVRELCIGKKNISEASIDVFNDDNKYGPDFFLLGMECFKDTVIVLDFEHNLLWVRKPHSL
ncbi:MAG TPA: hypothetical protein VMW24_17275 [Sedimentisphaerales bacterium]|nr:hypothetical protein [Sedimentisphaerales bacterium]